MKIKTYFSQKPLGHFNQIIIICSNDDPGLTLAYFTARSNFVKKSEKSGFFRNNCSL